MPRASTAKGQSKSSHRKVTSGNRKPPEERPYSWTDFDPPSHQSWHATISLLKSLEQEVAVCVLEGTKRGLDRRPLQKKVATLIASRLPQDMRSVREVLAIANFDFNFGVSWGTFPEMALTWILLPKVPASGRRSEYASAIRNALAERDQRSADGGG